MGLLEKSRGYCIFFDNELCGKNLLKGIMYASNAKSVWMDIQEIFTKFDGSKTLNLHKVVPRLNQRNAFVSVYFSKFKKFIGF